MSAGQSFYRSALSVALRILLRINSVASVVIGPHDLIAIIQGVDADALARIVVNDIQAVEGVTRTNTYMVVTPEPDEG